MRTLIVVSLVIIFLIFVFYKKIKNFFWMILYKIKIWQIGDSEEFTKNDVDPKNPDN